MLSLSQKPGMFRGKWAKLINSTLNSTEKLQVWKTMGKLKRLKTAYRVWHRQWSEAVWKSEKWQRTEKESLCYKCESCTFAGQGGNALHTSPCWKLLMTSDTNFCKQKFARWKKFIFLLEYWACDRSWKQQRRKTILGMGGASVAPSPFILGMIKGD